MPGIYDLAAYYALRPQMFFEYAVGASEKSKIGPLYGPPPPVMTVADLIEKLRKLDPNAEVGHTDYEYGYEPWDITEEIFVHDGRVEL